MELFGKHQCIECDSAYVVAKKITNSQPLNHPIFGKCLKYVCQRDGEAQIRKELNPLVSRLPFRISALNLGDKISANAFYVMQKGFRPQRLKKVHFSGAHNAQAFTTSDYTFAEISKPYPVGLNVRFALPPGYVSPISFLQK